MALPVADATPQTFGHMSTLAEEVAKFRQWADSAGLHPGCGEWELDYLGWDEFYAAVEIFVETATDRVLGSAELDLLLYALARDIEGYRIHETMERFPTVAIQVLQRAVGFPDTNARWQAALLLGSIRSPDAISLLQHFLTDEAESVRKVASWSIQD